MLDEERLAAQEACFARAFAARRYRSIYVVICRYRGGLIAQQELHYDPSGHLEELHKR